MEKAVSHLKTDITNALVTNLCAVTTTLKPLKRQGYTHQGDNIPPRLIQKRLVIAMEINSSKAKNVMQSYDWPVGIC